MATDDLATLELKGGQGALDLPCPPAPAGKPKARKKPARRPSTKRKPNAPEIIHVTDVKDDIISMEHPLFALQAGDTRIRNYSRNGLFVTIKPGPDGCATIHDKDLWLYCITLLVHKINRNLPVDQTVRFTAYDFMKATKRRTDGDSYKRFLEMLRRLKGTTIATNIDIDGLAELDISPKEKEIEFGLLDSWKIVTKTPNDPRQVGMQVTLPLWLFRRIEAKQVLTMPHEYFDIRKALARRIYEIARKHCGYKRHWPVSLTTLHEKSASTRQLKHFRSEMRSMVDQCDLLDYFVQLDRKSDMVNFYRKGQADLVEALMEGTPSRPAL